MHTQLIYHSAVAQLDERRRAARRHPDDAVLPGSGRATFGLLQILCCRRYALVA